MAFVDQTRLDELLGGVTLRASANVQGSTINADSGVEVGKGRYALKVVVTVLDITSNDEHYIIDLQANTRSATSTWEDIGTAVCLGPVETTGRAADSATGTYWYIFENPNDYQIRAVTYLIGSTAGGITWAGTLYALPRKE